MAEQSFERNFILKRSTKNKHVFAEIDTAGVPEAVGSLYVSKGMLPEGTEQVRVRVEATIKETTS